MFIVYVYNRIYILVLFRILYFFFLCIHCTSTRDDPHKDVILSKHRYNIDIIIEKNNNKNSFRRELLNQN